MVSFKIPKERLFGWELKPITSSHFAIHTRPSGQLNVLLDHALLRGCTTEMIYWWFRNFATLRVRLEDVEGYEGAHVPAYWLWHPFDHHSVRLGGETDGGRMTAGSTIHIREVMNYKQHGMRYPVDNKMHVPYLAEDGMTLHRGVPILGDVVYGRIHFKDVRDASGEILGVHYYYEFVAGIAGSGALGKFLTALAKKRFGHEFFAAWHLHNVIEVGTFENFLPALWAQRDNLDDLTYAKAMNPELESPSTQRGFDRALFDERLEGYKQADDAFEYLAPMAPTFL